MRTKLLPILLLMLVFCACGSQSQASTTPAGPQPAPTCKSSVAIASTNSPSSTAPQGVTPQHMQMGPHMKMTTYRPVAANDMARVEAIAQNSEVCFAKYKDYHLALRDGYQIFTPNVPQDIYHFASVQNFQEAQTTFDLAHPSALLYRAVGKGYQLAGVMYSAPANTTEDQLNRDIPLSVLPWHLHVNICLPAGDGGRSLFPGNSLFGLTGTITTQAQCTKVGGTFYLQMFGWMVHIPLFGNTSVN